MATKKKKKEPVVIYMASPKTIHVDPSEFMSLVQRLTGSSSLSPAAVDSGLPTRSQPSRREESRVLSGHINQQENTVNIADSSRSWLVLGDGGGSSRETGRNPARAPVVLETGLTGSQASKSEDEGVSSDPMRSSSSDLDSPRSWLVLGDGGGGGAIHESGDDDLRRRAYIDIFGQSL